MKRRLSIALLTLLTNSLLLGQETKPAQTFDFEKDKVGEEPEGSFVLDGTAQVVEIEGGKVLHLGPAPLTETAVQLGQSARGTQRINAKVTALKKRRSTPRFAIGVHGISGYRLRIVPATGKAELVRNEEAVETKDFAWESGVAYRLELFAVKDADGKWLIEARAWKDSEERPAEALFKTPAEKMSGQGKASVYATPYSGTPIEFDDVAITFE